jgi:hypothetical protein
VAAPSLHLALICVLMANYSIASPDVIIDGSVAGEARPLTGTDSE